MEKFRELVITKHAPKVGGILTGTVELNGELADFSGSVITDVRREYIGYTVTTLSNCGNRVYRVVVDVDGDNSD